MSAPGAGDALPIRHSQLPRQPDAVLVAAARWGSEAAFAQIVRRYERPLQSYCARRLDPALAKDAVQQTFLQALVALRRPGIESELVLRPWLYRLAHRCAIDIARRTSHEQAELDLSFDGVARPPQIFEQQERLHETIAAVRRLPSSQRRALVARELEGRSYQEISDELGHSQAGVRQLIFRARSALRNGLSVPRACASGADVVARCVASSVTASPER